MRLASAFTLDAIRPDTAKEGVWEQRSNYGTRSITVPLLPQYPFVVWSGAKQELSGVAELIVAKQRNGPTGEVPLTFLKQFTRFESRAETQEPAEKVVSMLRARPRVFT